MKRLIIAAAVAATLGAWTVQADEAAAYTVVEGDDLTAIAKRFGTTVEAIEETNALTSSKIEAGATLQIPN